MTTQVTVRLPNDLVDYVDKRVQSGQAKSRASVVAAALAAARKREQSDREIEIIKAIKDDDDDLDELVRWAQHRPLDLD